MKKTAEKNTAANTTTAAAENNTVCTNLLFVPERKVMDAASAQNIVRRCSDYNEGRSEARNFKCTEFRGITFKGEDLSGIEAHYSRFIDCKFEEVKLDRMEGYFMELSNCEFKNCSLENANLSYATISNCNFYNSNLNGVDMPFARGNWAATSCMMERCTAQNANLLMVLSNCNVIGFEGNFANIGFDIADSNLRRSEFNEGSIKGKITKTDLTNSEWNRSNLSELEIVDCATSGMETEDSIGLDEGSLDNDGFDDAFLEKALNELEEDVD